MSGQVGRMSDARTAGPLEQLEVRGAGTGSPFDEQRDGGVLSHNDFLYFIDPVRTAAPSSCSFRQREALGGPSLSSGIVATWADGIANRAKSLLGPAA
jgi:hypothetical protein